MSRWIDAEALSLCAAILCSISSSNRAGTSHFQTEGAGVTHQRGARSLFIPAHAVVLCS